MSKLRYWMTIAVVTSGIAVILSGTSCERAERVAPPQTEPSALQSSGEDGVGEDSEGEVIFVGTADELMPDSLTLLGDSLTVSAGDEPDTLAPREPDEFVVWLQSAYEWRNAEMVAMILADDYVCTEITPCGQRSWGKDAAIRIHERMFDPACEVKPIEDIQLDLGNFTVRPPLGDPEDPAAVWTIRCDAHLVFGYVNAEDGIWEFVGPAEFLIRVNPDSPCGWELVAWHDQAPHNTE